MTKEPRVNQGIRAKEVRVIGEDGGQLGVMPLKEALKIAEEHDLDLVEIAPGAMPPVCKVINYGKYRYQISKRHSTKHKTIEVKEVKIRPWINEHDLNLKIKNISRFLEDGNKAKITMIFRGREIVHSSLGQKIFDRIYQEFSQNANVEQAARLEGHRMIMVIAPKSK